MKVSVCMAVYNGAPYLEPQVQSILSQLQIDDELIVLDDASTDESVALLDRFNDPRLRVYHNGHNVGVLATFEKALRLAQGDILFLSDQDDIWLSGKVNIICSAFQEKPTVTLLVSDANVIDASGGLISVSFFSQRGPFKSGVLHNLIKNKYLGCTMAFRRSMLAHFLPIPEDVPMHDMWFGMVNEIYGEALYVDQPLISYRRHGSNLSPSEGASIFQQLIWRWRLAKNLVWLFLCRRSAE